MITLLTGQPGHGKTAYAVKRIFDFKKEGRTVYVNGIKDFNYEAAECQKLEDPKRWMDLPDGSVVVLDEVYNDFPARNAASAVPEHVKLLATHRHRGFDFIFIAQQTVQIDPFLKGLFEEHIHVKKKFGKYTKLKRWNSFQSNVKAICGDEMDWVRPAWVFKYYTSTTVDTSRMHVPRWLIMVGIVTALCLLGGYYLKSSWQKKTQRNDATGTGFAIDGAAAPPRGTSGAVAAPNEPRWETPTDYARDHLPRFGTMPWTAPIYDTRPVTVDPQLYCMSSSGGLDAAGQHREPSCSCMTEQGTRYDLGQAECRTVARTGMPYNPYRQNAPQQPVQVAAHHPVGVDLGGPQRGATGVGSAFGSMHSSYGDTGVATGRYAARGFSRAP